MILNSVDLRLHVPFDCEPVRETRIISDSQSLAMSCLAHPDLDQWMRRLWACPVRQKIAAIAEAGHVHC